MEEEQKEEQEQIENQNNSEESQENISVSKSKMDLVKKLLENIKNNTDRLEQLLSPLSDEDEIRLSVSQMSDVDISGDMGGDSRIIEGVFDGEQMIGPDGKQYSMPANYASKSKLVEGDTMKLTITGNGTFVYKQIMPIERKRITGVLEKKSDGGFCVVSEGKKWKVLTASATYFKGEEGDEAVILVPKIGESKWGAVENIVKKPV